MEFWVYYNDLGLQTLRMAFAPLTGKLDSFAYYPDEKSDLSDMKVFLTKYSSGLKLVERPKKGFEGRDFVSPDRYFYDSAKGIGLQTDETGGKIQDISFFEPKPAQKRTLGSQKK